MTLNSNIYCSTTGAGSNSAFEVARSLINNGVQNIELSGGTFVQNPLLEINRLKLETQKLLIHNYFPVPEKSFVLNLASMNKKILSDSIKFLKNSILIAADLSTRKFALHSGFLIDPKPTELGGIILGDSVQDRDVSLQIFAESISELAQFASQNSVELLIENNVMSAPNYEKHGRDIFLLSHPKEIVSFFNHIPDNVGLLIDTGHLKVSSKTLGFSFNKAMVELASLTKGYHLSENFGSTDDHLPFNLQDCEYRNLIVKNLDYYCLEFKSYELENICDQVSEFSEFFC